MATPRRLLVPTDFTETSRRAYDLALELASRLRAEVVLVHCYAINAGGISPYGVLLPEPADTELRESAQRSLDAWADAGDDAGVPVSTRLLSNVPALGIAECIEKEGADLVVMGTHGRRGLARVALGSVAAAVLRTAPVPVLTVRGGDDADQEEER